MKAEELIIGAYVCNGKNPPMYVVAINRGEVQLDIEGNNADPFDAYIEDLQPIPLDEKWLVDFGFIIQFKQVKKVYNEYGNIFQLNKVDGKNEFTWGASEINYVHELQQLYLLLCKQPLTIKTE